MKVYLTRNNWFIASSVTLVNNMKGSKMKKQPHRTLIWKCPSYKSYSATVTDGTCCQLYINFIHWRCYSFCFQTHTPLSLIKVWQSSIWTSNFQVIPYGIFGSFSLNYVLLYWHTVISEGRFCCHRY